jgi:hypothetical protein
MTTQNAEARLSALAANTAPPPPLPPTKAGGGGLPEPAHRHEIARALLEMALDAMPPKAVSPTLVWQRSRLLSRLFRTSNATGNAMRRGIVHATMTAEERRAKVLPLAWDSSGRFALLSRDNLGRMLAYLQREHGLTLPAIAAELGVPLERLAEHIERLPTDEALLALPPSSFQPARRKHGGKKAGPRRDPEEKGDHGDAQDDPEQQAEQVKETDDEAEGADGPGEQAEPPAEAETAQ